MARVSGSAEAATDLKVKAINTVRSMVELQSGFKNSLSVLGASTRDESFEKASYYCGVLENELRTLLPEVSVVIKRLDAYIQFIERIEIKVAGGSGQISSSGMSKPAGTSGAGRTSKEVWQYTDEGCIYDSPDKTGKGMRHSQTRGNCGLCAIENLTIMAGNHMDLNYIESRANLQGLCDKDGGTSYENRRDILASLGISSHLETPTIEGLAAAVTSGRGVIVAVDCAKLSPYGYNGIVSIGFEPHALLVTSVVTDKVGNVTDIIVCDSNSDSLRMTGAIRYPVSEFFNALIADRKMNVTDDVIR